MGLSGKYNFNGIKKLNAVGLKAILASTPYFAWILKGGALTDAILEFIGNYIANYGLVLLNTGAIFVEGEFDQKSFDAHLDDAIKKVELSGGKLTPEQIKAIDDQVILAARRFIVITKHP